MRKLNPSTVKKIVKDTQIYYQANQVKRFESKSIHNEIWLDSPPILLPYQRVLVGDESGVTVVEKSRRTGATWAYGCWAVLEAVKPKRPTSTYYLGTSKDMTREFVEIVGYWAKSLGLVAAVVEETIVDESDKQGGILKFRVEFATGKSVVALSSKPSAVRGSQGNVILDEAGFVDDLDKVVKAVMALRMWGGKIRILSTHNGVDNPFNKIIGRIRSGELKYRLLKIPLMTAVEMGLYRRICLVTGETWSEEGEQAWVEEQYRDYGIGADEELGCVPLEVKGGGKVFKREWWNYSPEATPDCWYWVRFWDMAATARDLKADAYYTAGVLMGRDSDGVIWVKNADARQLSPSDGDDWICDTAQHDGVDVWARWEMEGGSAGLKVASYLEERLKGINARGIKPQGDKLTRAKPFASELMRGNVRIVGAESDGWVKRYVDAMYGFDGSAKPLTNDFADASSGAYNSLINEAVSPTLLS